MNKINVKRATDISLILHWEINVYFTLYKFIYILNLCLSFRNWEFKYIHEKNRTKELKIILCFKLKERYLDEYWKRYEVASFPKTFEKNTLWNCSRFIFILSHLDIANLLTHTFLLHLSLLHFVQADLLLESTETYKMYSPTFL